MDASDDPSPHYAPSRSFESPNDPAAHLHGEPNGVSGQPLLDIWTSPRRTIRRIVHADPTYLVNPLIALAGIAEALDRSSSRNAGDKLSLAAILFMCFVVAPGMSLIATWFYSHMLRISGNWLGGRGDYFELKAAIAWASVPKIAALVLWIPLLLLVGKEMFTEEMPTIDNSPVIALALLAVSLPLVVLGLWAFILLCNTIAEVQGFGSAWMGLANMILAGLILVVPLVLLALLVWAITAGPASGVRA